MGLGSSGTFVRPPALASRFNDIFLPRKMEFKGWVKINKQCSHQGLTGSEVTNFIKDLHRMVHDQKYIDWDQTRTAQGTWPTKTIVSMWFRNETNLPTMVGMLDIIKNELKKDPYKLHGQEIFSRLEICPKRKCLAKAHALFYKGLKKVGGDESKIHVVYGKIQVCFFVRSVMAAKYTPEGEDLARKGWNIKPDVVAGICTEFGEALFEAVVNSSSRRSRIFRRTPDRQVDIWQLISVNINRQRSLNAPTVKENCWGLLVHTRTLLPFSSFKRLSPGMCRVWNCLEMCVYGSKSGFAKLLVLKTFLQN